MTKNTNSFYYTVKPNPEKNSFKISTNSAHYPRLIEFLLQNKQFVKDHRSLLSQLSLPSRNNFIEIDHRGLEMLTKRGQEIGAFSKNSVTLSAPDQARENKLQASLNDLEYDITNRIWSKQTDTGEVYFCEVEEDVYSCASLEKLTQFLKGEYLVESNKNPINFSLNPLKSFGIFEVLGDAISSNKSLIHLNKSNNFPYFAYKKKFDPVIEHITHIPIVIDGADDTANAMNNTGLPQQAMYLAQALVIFPVFLRGVYIGYEGLGDEARDNREEFEAATYQQAELKVKIAEYRRKLCDICDIDYEATKNDEPNIFLQKLTQSFYTLEESAKNELIALAEQYQKEVEEELNAPKAVDVLAAYCGWLAMTSMMASVGAYEFQALANIGGGIENITKTLDPDKLSLISQIGNNLGLAGQCLMVLYASHKTLNESQAWSETQKELEQFSRSKNVSDLTKSIATKLLRADRNNHAIQTFGNATLAAGQGMMIASGPSVLGSAPLLFGGLAATLAGVAVNSTSELLYQAYQASERDPDDLEKKIITEIPQFSLADFANLNESLQRHAKERLLKLELLGHLRAPQLILYQKYSSENSGIFARIADEAGKKLANLLGNLPTDSLDLIRHDPLITAHPNNPNDLSVFEVSEEDLEIAYAKTKELQQTGTKELQQTGTIEHTEIVRKIQQEFIRRKNELAQRTPAKTTLQLCQSIIAEQKPGSVYLTKKLLRAVANHDSKLTYDGSLDDGSPEIKKNGKKILATKLDLTKFNPTQLEAFLTIQRPAKNNPFTTKSSVLTTANTANVQNAQLEHLGTFRIAADLNNSAEQFIGGNPFSPELDDPLPPIGNDIDQEDDDIIPPLLEDSDSEQELENDLENHHDGNSDDEHSPLISRNRASAISEIQNRTPFTTNTQNRVAPSSQKISGNISLLKPTTNLAKKSNPVDQTTNPILRRNTRVDARSNTQQNNNSAQNLSESENNIPESSTKKLLEDFSTLAKSEISKSPEVRKEEVKKQNKVINKIIKKTTPFILISKTPDSKNNTTTFIYADPNCQDSSHPDYYDRQITYIRDNQSGKIEVIYGNKAKAFLVERPNQEKNGVITKLDSGNIEHFGQKSDSTFTNFSKCTPKSSTTNVTHQTLRNTPHNKTTVTQQILTQL